MKKITVLTLLSVFALSGIFFTGCKYEDGPVVSLRSKKMRFTNTWQVVEAQLAGSDITSQYNREDFIISFDVYKDGFYSFTLRDENGNPLSRTGSNPLYSQVERELSQDRPVFMQLVGGSGKWSFVNNMNSVQMRHELSQDSDNPVVPVLDIKELRNNRLKLTGVTEDGDDIEMTFETLERD